MLTAVNGLSVDVDGALARVSLGDDDVDGVQRVVGGPFDVVVLSASVHMWVNDEGVFTCQPNPFASMLASELSGRGKAFLFGRVLLTGGVGAEGETLSLDDVNVRAVEALVSGWLSSGVDMSGLVSEMRRWASGWAF